MVLKVKWISYHNTNYINIGQNPSIRLRVGESLAIVYNYWEYIE